jgi:hypothetical protein
MPVSLLAVVGTSLVVHLATFHAVAPAMGGWKASTVCSSVHIAGALMGSALTIANTHWSSPTTVIAGDTMLLDFDAPFWMPRNRYVPRTDTYTPAADLYPNGVFASHVVAASVGYFIADSAAMLFFFRDPRNAASLLHHALLLMMLVPSLTFGTGINVIATLLIEEASTVPLNVKEFTQPGSPLNTACQGAFVLLFFWSRFWYSLTLMASVDWALGFSIISLPNAVIAYFQLTVYGASRVLNAYWGWKIVNKVRAMLSGSRKTKKE